ncbi:hypothetical protein [Methylovulum psychrotolerans]|uniref:Uncharacterized protein n=1 Tax=Methylovulum psychrotolerans TaxID=1704499 RepID=A0A1Z4C3H3_9GAMM|nr:hypothetical protein [Methylovulum psychrotolerans]ASF48083.1 hypothetical protein CEK71_19515 [Methylovulum psychrotolerans]
MGGLGSGRQYGGRCTDDCQTLDVRQWQRKGLLVAGTVFSTTWSNGAAIRAVVEADRVRLVYSVREYGGDWEPLDYAVILQTTACHYGGVRHWFTCPAVRCGKRVAVLYQGGKYFACRNCYRLAYRSQRDTQSDRLIHKADKLRDKLGWEPGILNGNGDKPKGMHWKTFRQLQAEHDRLADAGVAMAMRRFKCVL